MTTVQMAPANRDEMNAVNLADAHADKATAQIDTCRPGFETAVVYALLAIDARIDALRETLNRELPDIDGAMLDAAREMPDGD